MPDTFTFALMTVRIPTWLVHVTWFIAGVFGTGAFWYYLSQKDVCATSISAAGALLFVVISVVLHIAGDGKAIDPKGETRDIAGSEDLRQTRKAHINSWRASIEALDHGFMDEERLREFLSSSIYSTMRPLLTADVLGTVEKPRTAYMGGFRGDNVRKYLLLDEVTRIEREWGLV